MNNRSRLCIIFWLAFSILLLVGLYLGLQSFLVGREGGDGPQYRTYRLSISAPRLDQELPTLKATQGDRVSLLISSDRPGEADVHGYERKVRLESGGEVTLSFTATEPGVFPLHLHEELYPGKPDSPINHRHLAMIEVQPN